MRPPQVATGFLGGALAVPDTPRAVRPTPSDLEVRSTSRLPYVSARAESSRSPARRICEGFIPVGSTGRRNTFAKSLSWGLEAQCFPWPLVELARHLAEVRLRERR